MDTPENHPEPLSTDIGAVHFSGVLTMGGGVIHGGGPLWISEDTTTS
jgi:hypothetical protein